MYIYKYHKKINYIKLKEKILHVYNYYYCCHTVTIVYNFAYICKVKHKQISVILFVISQLNKKCKIMKTQKIDSFVKTVSILFSGYMLILMAVIIILNK